MHLRRFPQSGVLRIISIYCRALEISATDDTWWPDVEVTGCAIRSSEPDSWPLPRKVALKRMFAAVIGDAVETGEYYKLDGWICAIARSGFDVAPHLEQIATSPAAVLAYFEDNVTCLPVAELCNAFWELPCNAHAKLSRGSTRKRFVESLSTRTAIR